MNEINKINFYLSRICFLSNIFILNVCSEPLTSFSQYPTIASGLCVATESVNIHYYNFITESKPVVTFDPIRGWSIAVHERCNPIESPSLCSTYSLEAVRYYSSPISKCTYCPYHLDPYWSSNIPSIDQTNQDDPTNPMFGPCLSNSHSLKMPCLQHHALYPQKFFGKYYYAPQRPFLDSVWQEWFGTDSSEKFNIPMHHFLHEGATSSPYNMFGQPKDPSDYAIGKKAVESHLGGINFIYSANGSVNIPLTNAFKSPYIPVNGVEQWMKWAQYFCFPGCHRNSRHSWFRIRGKDIAGDPELSYLSLYINDTNPQYLPACRPCPNYTASYNWMSDSQTSGPAHPKTNILADQCYPWFGAIPTMVPLGDSYVMNMTYKVWNSDVDKVVSPSYDSIVDIRICPVNTYNRICAHTKEFYYNSAFDSSPPSAVKLKQYACTPCPQELGYHTAGKTGQWYCQPPPGKLFSERILFSLDGGQDEVWSNREIMSQYPEMECGPKTEHCRQCSDFNRPDTTPEQFNEDYIFSRLLAEEWCPERYFCPDAFTQVECPRERPWSPIGSWNISNCTCSKGYYLMPNGSACLPCTSTCKIPGYYLPRSQCLEKNGATKDAPCTLCDNIPSGATAVSDGYGVELRPGYGTCPFYCILGSELETVNTSLGKCEKSFSCSRPRARTNKDGWYVWKESFEYDRLTIEWSTLSAFSCIVRPLFTQQLAKIDTDPTWHLQPRSCIGICNSSRVCYAQNQSTNPGDPPWYSILSPVNCIVCPGVSELPLQSYLQINPATDLLLGSQYCQAPNILCATQSNDDMFYFNKSSWQCQACSAREKSICPVNTKLRGGGCLGVFTPFNLSVPSVDCFPCPIQVPNFNNTKGKQYLNYKNISAPGGCSIDPCPAIRLNSYFWKRPCGGDSPGEQEPCSKDCPSYQFRKVECTAESDLVCQNCTVNKPGFQKVSNCSLTENSVWRPCDPGFFCDLYGNIVQCPRDRTSLAGADDISDCFCKVGMREDAQTSKCIPIQCVDSVIMTNIIPGQSVNSSYYMTLDLETMSSTKCVPCNTFSVGTSRAFTRGDGLEITSCVCPRGYYGIYPAADNLTSIECIPCPSTCSAQNKLPTSCANGDVKVVPGQPFPCVCPVTPFSTSSLSSCSTTTTTACQPGFIPSNIPRVVHAGSVPQVSGSSLYTVKNWNRFIATSGFSSFNNSVRSLTVTGCMDDSILGNEDGGQIQVYHYEYIFWIVSDPGLPIVFSALLQDNIVDMPSSLLFTLPQWQVFGSGLLSAPDSVLVGIAASKWNTRDSYYYNTANRDPWVYVAALIRASDDGSGLFYMKAKVFNTTNNRNTGYWEKPEFNLTLPFAANTRNAVPVAITHCTKKLGEAALFGEGGLFYIAFNTWVSENQPKCGGFIVASPIFTSSSSLFLVSSFCKTAPADTISSMALTLSQDSSMPLVLISFSSGNIVKIESASQIDARVFPISSSSNSLISSTSSSFIMNNLIVLFSMDTPIYLSGMYSEILCGSNNFDGSYCLKIADSAELSWVDIQGLPWGSAPTSQPMNMVASISNRAKAQLIVSKGPSIYTITVSRCPSSTQYWDGVACTEQSCLRQATCSFPMVPTSDGVGCICANGYYYANPLSSSTNCISCTLPKYCEAGVALSCPFGMSTTVNLASSINNCICPIQGTFFNGLLVPPRCFECRNVDSWCPNKWQSFSCPGSAISTALLSTTLISFPTKCSCAPGFTGANCEPCPSGFYCPGGSSYNAMNTAAFYTFPQPPLTSVILESINSFFLSYLTMTATKLPNFASQADLNKILYTQVIPATNRTQYGVMVMIQIDLVSSPVSFYDTFKSWHGPLLDFLGTRSGSISVIPSSSATIVFDYVQVNRPQQCITSKVPGNPPSSCICAPGYETNKEQCSACPANTFKAYPGPGACVACAIGTIASIKATACVPDPALLNSNNNSNNNQGPDIMLLVGGIGGGFVGLIVLLFLVQNVIKRSHGEL